MLQESKAPEMIVNLTGKLACPDFTHTNYLLSSLGV